MMSDEEYDRRNKRKKKIASMTDKKILALYNKYLAKMKALQLKGDKLNVVIWDIQSVLKNKGYIPLEDGLKKELKKDDIDVETHYIKPDDLSVDKVSLKKGLKDKHDSYTINWRVKDDKKN